MQSALHSNQAALLNRLYDMKRQQIERAQQQSAPLRCQVLEAEAQAISDALKALR
ncbi:MAG: hypothetical protein SVX28_12610 [Pseudomonadota bacterium]|nr:hypothetical protein [Pseudomonadota bacterium]